MCNTAATVCCALYRITQVLTHAALPCFAVFCTCCCACAGVVLAAASPYFETLLRGWACSHQPLHMVVGEGQLPAAQQVRYFE